MSRKYDIWSLGCVFLEFVTWLVKGPAGVNKFSEKRFREAEDGVDDDTYFSIFTPDRQPHYVEVREGVTDWIGHLRQVPRQSKMTIELLNVIQKEMIIVDQTKRITAQALARKLDTLFETAKGSSSFLLGHDMSIIEPSSEIKIPFEGSVTSELNSDASRRLNAPEVIVNPP